jgi:hypothetical protein
VVLGKRSISADTALRFGAFFGLTAQFWLNLQTTTIFVLLPPKTSQRSSRIRPLEYSSSDKNPSLKEKGKMKSLAAVSLSLLYMFALTVFLSFAAMWVCDGYYPVGWGWKGSFLHCAFWAMPLSLFVGSVMAALVIHPRLASVLILIGTGPFVSFVLWDLQKTISAVSQAQRPWIKPGLVAAVVAIAADVILIRRAQIGSVTA